MIWMPVTVAYFSSHVTIADAQTSPIVVVLSAGNSQKLKPTASEMDTRTATSGVATNDAEVAEPGGLKDPAAHSTQDSLDVEPMTSLYQAYTIGNQLVEAYRRHHRAPRRVAVERAEIFQNYVSGLDARAMAMR